VNIKPIRTAEDYELTLQRIEDIFDAEPSSPDADELEVLSILVEDYENKNFPIDLPSPLAAIEFRMDQLGMKQNDLARILGSRSHTSEILSGKRSLSINQIRILHRELGIPTSILIGDGDPVV
jgi:HTH-type transcriptional regulator/antitoxin HigA